MKKNRNNVQLDFEVDKITNSIVCVKTNEVFQTVISQVKKSDLKRIKKSKWKFDWVWELKQPEREVYMLEIEDKTGVIHGLISLSDKGDHVQMDLLENAAFNYGKNKKYLGVAGNLVAYGCKISFEKGYNGYLAFQAKTELIPHYKKKLKAEVLFGIKMYISQKNSLTLVTKYFKDFKV